MTPGSCCGSVDDGKKSIQGSSVWGGHTHTRQQKEAMKNHQKKKKSSGGGRPGKSPAQDTSEIIDLRRNVGEHTHSSATCLLITRGFLFHFLPRSPLSSPYAKYWQELWGERLHKTPARRQRPVSVLLLRREQQQRKTSKHNHRRQKRERWPHSPFFTLHNFPIFPKSYDPDVLTNWQYGSDHLQYPLPRKRSATTNRADIYFLRNFTRIFFISTAQIRLSLTVPRLNGYDHLIFLLTRKQTNRQTFRTNGAYFICFISNGWYTKG